VGAGWALVDPAALLVSMLVGCGAAGAGACDAASVLNWPTFFRWFIMAVST
jgi:hypothetical protein